PVHTHPGTDPGPRSVRARRDHRVRPAGCNAGHPRRDRSGGPEACLVGSEHDRGVEGMTSSSRTTRIVLGILAVLIAIWMIAPTLIVIPTSFAADASFQFPPRNYSFRWYESLFTNIEWQRASLNSVVIGLC